MKIKNIIFIATILFFAVSCNNKEEKQLSEKEKLVEDITKSEKDLFDDVETDRDKALAVVDMYIDFSEKYPKDTLSPEYLFRAADIAMNFEQPHNAISYLQIIEEKYPEYNNYATSIFLIGFIYHNIVLDTEKARIYYNKYIENFPDHIYVKDAEGALMFMDLDDEQLIDVFEDINKYD